MKRWLLKALGIVALAMLANAPALAADTIYYYYTDTLHSAAAITDASGNVVERTYYAPYGQVLNRPLRDGPAYTGQYEDPVTGLDYMQQRYYDPTSGRFVSTDPVGVSADGGNFNRYWYASDNPYRYTDPDGRACRAATKTSPGGCWNTPAERKLANEGNWKAYYKLAGGKGHDPYAQRAGNVASNAGKGYEGLLDAITNEVLKISIADNLPVMPAIPAAKAVTTSMENIRVDLVKARVNLLDQKGATEQRPATMTRQEAADFHQSTFLKNGAGNVFGGKIYDSILSSPGRAMYNWCPEPSCN